MILKTFFVFEGIDGAGTTTQINLLRKRPDADRFVFTAEPSLSPSGKFLRQILSGEVSLDPRTTAFLFAADRNEHLYGNSSDDCGIVPKCTDGKFVVSDRYLFSSLTYQSVTCGEELPQKLNEDFPLPEILFFFDIDPEISLKRVLSRGETEIYEKLDFQKATAERYKAVIDRYEKMNTGMKIIRLDAARSVDEIAGEIASALPAVNS